MADLRTSRGLISRRGCFDRCLLQAQRCEPIGDKAMRIALMITNGSSAIIRMNVLRCPEVATFGRHSLLLITVAVDPIGQDEVAMSGLKPTLR